MSGTAKIDVPGEGILNQGQAIIDGVNIRTGSRCIRAGLNNSDKATTIITNSVLTATSSSDAIHNDYLSEVNINSSIIKSNSGIGIKNQGTNSTINLGIKDYPVSITNPEITGGTYGVSNSGTFNFYDGIIKGGTKAINGLVQNKPELYSVQTMDSEKTAILSIQGTFSQVAKVNGIYFDSLQQALNATTTGTITIEKDTILTEPMIIAAGKNITLNLNAHILRSALQGGLIINNGTLNIIDSQEDGTSTVEFSLIENLADIGIQNNNVLTLGTDDANVYTNAPRIIGATYGIVSQEGTTFNFYDGIIKGATEAIQGIITQITIQSGYSVKENQEIINEITYLTKYLGI